jgi:hypothetical protein
VDIEQDSPANVLADSAAVAPLVVVEVVREALDRALDKDYRKDKNAVHQQDAQLMIPTRAPEKQARYTLLLVVGVLAQQVMAV